MVGQIRLINQISTYTSETFPKSVLIVGSKGCGKHTFINEYVIPMLGKPLVDLTDDISFERLMEISLSVIPTVYFIDIDKVTERVQNVLLKFIEEPPETATIIMISTSLVNVIQTVQNRCSKWIFDPYSREELAQFLGPEDDASILQYAETPGMVLCTHSEDIKNIENLAKKLLTVSSKASLSNLLTVSQKIDWTDKEVNLFSRHLFYDILSKVSCDLYKERQIGFKVFDLTREYINQFKSVLQFDRKRMFEKYLVELKFGCNE